MNLEVYFDDMLVWSVTIGNHISNLEETFETLPVLNEVESYQVWIQSFLEKNHLIHGLK